MPAPSPYLGLGILSWRGREALRASLNGHVRAGLFSLFDETCIVFQECEDADASLAREFGLPWRGFADNLGIFGGFLRMAESLNATHVLFLEEDHMLVESFSEARRQIKDALADIEAGRAHCYQLRHLHKHDAALEWAVTRYKRYYPAAPAVAPLALLRRLLLRSRARRLRGRAVYCEASPHLRHGDVIRRTQKGHDIIDSSAYDWTNAGILINRRFMLDVILTHVREHPARRTRNGFQNIEDALRCRWWRRSGFKCGVARPGLFMDTRAPAKTRRG